MTQNILELRNWPVGQCTLFLQQEHLSATGSIKDRIVPAMIEAGVRAGKIGDQTTIIEASSGNTAHSLALYCAQRKRRLILVIPESTGPEKVTACRVLGAEVIRARNDVPPDHVAHYQRVAAALCRNVTNGYLLNQHENPVNPDIHEATTGPDILRNMDGQVDVIICGVGTGGTLTGIGRFMRRHSPRTKMILADPEGSAIAPILSGNPKASSKSLVEGIGKSYVPPLLDTTLVHQSYTIPDEETFATVQRLYRQEGIWAGLSTGTMLATALRYCQEQDRPQRVVTFACDAGWKYLNKLARPRQ